MKRLILACALAIPAAALADSDNAWYVNPQAGAIFPDYTRDLKSSDWAYGLGIGRELGPIFNLELNGNGSRIGNGLGTGHLNTYGYSLDLLAILHRENPVAPYLTIGAGAVRDALHDDVGTDRETNFMAQVGLGVMWRLWQNSAGTSSLMLRPEVKARWDDPTGNNPGNTHFVDAVAMVGVQYSFGGSAAAPQEAAAPPPPPPPPEPAPAPAPAAAPPPPPPSPPPAPPAIAIPSKGSVTLEGVNFEYNSAQLTGDSQPVLDGVARGLSQHPRVRVELQGYTDSTGSAGYNLRLSKQRADAVRDYLLGHGVQAEQLETRGFGKAHPIASNKTAEGRAQNRRVVMSVLSNPSDVTIKDGASPAAGQ